MSLETGTIMEERVSEMMKTYGDHFDEARFSNEHDEAYEPVYYFLKSKGKRIRPLLMLLSCDAFSGDYDQALSPSFGLELFHNFTLIHDDIMDKAEIRRGQPTLHREYSEGTAILAGDFLLILAYRYLSMIPMSSLPMMLERFNSTATKIIEGQVMDAEFEKQPIVEENDYLKMIEYKTSVLIAFSLQMGAELGGASLEDQDLMYEFGLNLGLAFQLKDDWLDVYGDQSLGKKIGGDILRNKKTYLYIKAMNKLNGQNKEELMNLSGIRDDSKKIERAIDLFNLAGVDRDLEDLMEYYYKKALSSLDQTSLASQKKEDLVSFTEKIYQRHF